MPICHISCKSVSHSSGRTAPAAAAYRAGDRIKNEMDGRTHDYSRKGGVAHAEIIVPEGTPKPTRAELWNAAEKADTRKNSAVAREWEVALPCELSAQERKTLALEFGRWLCAEYGVAADVAIHAPNAKGDQRNHHAHVLTTTRTWDGQLGAKTRILDAKETRAQEVTKVRKAWETLCNRALERAGSDERISAGKLPDGQTATIHVGVGAKAITRKGGEVSSRELHNERVMELRRLAAELAAAREAEPPEHQPPAPEKSEMEKRRDAILAHPSVNATVRGMLTTTGWEGWVETYEGLLGIVPGAEQEPQPAAADLDNEVLDEQIGVADAKPQAPDPALVDAAMSKLFPQRKKEDKPINKSQGRGWSR